MGPTLRVEPIWAGEEPYGPELTAEGLKSSAKREPINAIGVRHAPGPRVNPRTGGELLTRPIRFKRLENYEKRHFQ